MQKVRLNENKISDMLRMDETHSRTVHKTVYSLKDYDRFAGFDGVVRLKSASYGSGKLGKDEGRDEGRKQTTTREVEGREGRKKEKEREKRESEPSGAASEDFSHISEKNEKNPSAKAKHSENHPSANPSPTFPDLPRTRSISKNTLPTSPDGDKSEQSRITPSEEREARPKKPPESEESKAIREAAVKEYGEAGWVAPDKLSAGKRYARQHYDGSQEEES